MRRGSVSERGPQRLAALSLAVSFLALTLSAYALYAQQESEANLREIGEELQRALTPTALPMEPPPLTFDPDDT